MSSEKRALLTTFSSLLIDFAPNSELNYSELQLSFEQRPPQLKGFEV